MKRLILIKMLTVLLILMCISTPTYTYAQKKDYYKIEKEIGINFSKIGNWFLKDLYARKKSVGDKQWSKQGTLRKITYSGDYLRGERDRYIDYTAKVSGAANIRKVRVVSYSYNALNLVYEINSIAKFSGNRPSCDASTSKQSIKKVNTRAIFELRSGYIRVEKPNYIPIETLNMRRCFKGRYSSGYRSFFNGISNESGRVGRQIKEGIGRNMRIPYQYMTFLNTLDANDIEVLQKAIFIYVTSESDKAWNKADNYIRTYYKKKKDDQYVMDEAARIVKQNYKSSDLYLKKGDVANALRELKYLLYLSEDSTKKVKQYLEQNGYDVSADIARIENNQGRYKQNAETLKWLKTAVPENRQKIKRLVSNKQYDEALSILASWKNQRNPVTVNYLKQINFNPSSEYNRVLRLKNNHSSSTYGASLKKANESLRSFNNNDYEPIEVKFGSIISKAIGNETRQIKISDIEDVTFSKALLAVRINCKGGTDCAYNGSQRYKSRINFYGNNRDNSQRFYEELKGLVAILKASNNNSKPVIKKSKNYTQELARLNKYLKTYSNGYYGPISIENGRLLDYVKRLGKYRSIEIKKIDNITYPKNSVRLNCAKREQCATLDSGKPNNVMGFSSSNPGDKKEDLFKLLKELIIAYNKK